MFLPPSGFYGIMIPAAYDKTMYTLQRFFEQKPRLFSQFLLIIPFFYFSVKKKLRQSVLPQFRTSLCPEGLAVGALILGGIAFVGTHQNPVQRAVVLGIAVVSAGLDGAFNALVCMAVHKKILLFVWYGLSMSRTRKSIQEKSVNVAFCDGLCYCGR